MLLFVFGASAVQAQTATTPDTETRKERPNRDGKRGDRADLTPAQAAEKQTERMAKHLNLTDEQIVSVNAVHLDFATREAKMREQAGDDREQQRADRKALRDEQNTAIEQLLTPEQIVQLEAHRAEQKGGKKGKRGKRGGKKTDGQRR